MPQFFRAIWSDSMILLARLLFRPSWRSRRTESGGIQAPSFRPEGRDSGTCKSALNGGVVSGRRTFMARVTGGGGFMPFFVPHLWSPFWEMGWGGGRARAQCGVRRPRVSIRGNKEELLKQIMSESSARKAKRHQNALVRLFSQRSSTCPRPQNWLVKYST